MHDRVVLRGGLDDEEFVLTSWTSASPFQRACALERHEAARVFSYLTMLDRHTLEFHRPHILTLAGMSWLGDHRIHAMDLRQRILDHLSSTGRLILVSEGLHLPPCGAGHQRDALDETPESAEKSRWSGDSSKWSQEKKLGSMHPELRPLVTGVVEGMTKRGFQPKIFFGWRSVAVQLEIFHNVQKKDGTPDAYAADIVDQRWAWGKQAAQHGYWSALGEEAKKQNLFWGGDWRKPDWAHVQLVPNSQLKRLKGASGL